MIVDGHDALPVVRVDQIPHEENAQRWLVEQLWGDSSVGVIGGAPKCSKTWLGLDLALSVATGTACLGRYAVPQPGPVLVYLAEDALAVVRERVEGMARHRGLYVNEILSIVLKGIWLAHLEHTVWATSESLLQLGNNRPLNYHNVNMVLLRASCLY